MTLRILSTDSLKQTELKNSLKNYEPFIIAHLIKFEQPSSMDRSNSRSGINYSYITDNSYDIQWDDGSQDAAADNNGLQIYRANKIISIGTVNENIIAKAASMTLKLDSASLGLIVTLQASLSKDTATTGTLITDTDLASLGFQEGDTVTNTVGNTKVFYTLGNFSNEGKTVKVRTTEAAFATKSYTLKQDSSELNALLVQKTNANDYAGYINREVFIYKCHISPETRQIIGDPFLYFKGIISSGSLTEKTDSSEVSWTLHSHWGDFLQIKGRISDDATHRALNSVGESDEGSLIKSAYKGDFGFLHANTAYTQAIKYRSSEEESYYRKDQSVTGMGTGSLQTRTIEVERTVSLDFNLQAKQIPLIYGVRKVKSFPVFVDTINNNQTSVYKVDVLCEGPVASMYDIIVDGNSITCSDAFEYSSRGYNNLNADSNFEQVCYGNKARGDVLEKTPPIGIETCVYPGAEPTGAAAKEVWLLKMERYETCTRAAGEQGITTDYSGAAVGLQHDDRYTIPRPTPIYTDLMFHAGKPNQEADGRLVAVTLDPNPLNRFTLQNNYFDNSKGIPYWSSSHRLLDTCYVSSNYAISDGETTIPDLEYVIRGLNVECHNYDDSFAPRSEQVLADNSYFLLGDEVDIYVLPGEGTGTANIASDTRILQNVRIIDKFLSLETDIDSTEMVTRYRWSTNPSTNIVNFPNAANFYMTILKGGVRYYWYMTKSNTPIYTASEITEPLVANLSPTYNEPGTAAGTRKLSMTTFTENAGQAFIQNDDVAIVALYDDTVNGIDTQYGAFTTYTYGTGETNKLDNVPIASDKYYTKVKIVNGLQLSSASSNVDDIYVGMSLTYNRVVDLGQAGKVKKSQTQRIIKYDGSHHIAFVEEPWDFTLLPGEAASGDTESYSLGTLGDRRPTINPAMQLLDYITDVRYGKGLDLEKDIDLESFKQAARDCDTRSKVSVVFPYNNYPGVGTIVEYPNQALQSVDNPIQWQGTAEEVSSIKTIEGTQYRVVTFTDCVGKLGKKWNDYQVLPDNQLFWHEGLAYIKDGSGVPVIANQPPVSSILLGQLGSSNTFSINISMSSANGNPIVKGYNEANNTVGASGYSLYDSDDVKYWRYTGWDEPTQRNVTRHQMNQLIDTGVPVFENINKMLGQFNGILTYSGGAYSLRVKGKKGLVDPDFEKITDDDIIGTIQINDGGLKNSKNYISASIMDPQNGFESRSISFFNSIYLKQDKGIQKKGQARLSGITNYFNARMNIEQSLNESRFSQEISFTMSPKGLMLTAGSIIELTYPRFGYVSKEFRITNLNFKKDGTVDVTADEHSDSIYKVSEPVISDIAQGERNNPRLEQVPAAPTNLSVNSQRMANSGQIAVQWTNSASWSPETHTTEVFRSTAIDFDAELSAGSFEPGTFYTIKTSGTTDFTDIGAPDNSAGTIFLATGIGSGTGTVSKVLLAGTSNSNYFIDEVRTGTGQQTRYYWIRYRVRKASYNVSGSAYRAVFSEYLPSSSSDGVSGFAYPVNVIRAIQISPAGKTFIYEPDGTGIYSGGATSVLSTSLINYTGGTSTYAWTIDGAPAAGINNQSTYTYTAPDAQASMPQIVKCTATELINEETFTFEDAVVMTGTVAAASGQAVKTVNIYRKNNNTISTASGTFADPLAGNTDWSLSVPTVDTDGDIVYVSTRTFSDDGLAPQEAAWSTPAIYSTRVDGENGQAVKTVNIYRKNNNNISTASGTFADPLAGNTSWSLSVPSLTTDGDIVYVSTRTFSDDGLAPQDVAWSTPVIYSTKVNGDPGDAGLRTIQGYLYYEKTTAGAPLTPSGSTYTFSTGDVFGGTGATEVLALSTPSAVDKWTNEPRTQDPASTNIHYTIRYSGTEAAAGSSTVAVTYASIVRYTNFTGIVTFENGDFLENGSTITTIDGGNIDASSQITVGTGVNKAGFFGDGTLGTDIRIFAGDTAANRAIAPFRVNQDGTLYATNAEIAGEVVASTLALTTSNEFVNLKAQSVVDESITLASLNSEVINFINSTAATLSGNTPGDYQTGNVLFSRNTPGVNVPLITISNFDHGLANPVVTVQMSASFYSPNAYDETQRIVNFTVYRKLSSGSTWTSLFTTGTVLSFQVFPQNPAFTRYYYAGFFSQDFEDTTLTDNLDYDYKIELNEYPEVLEPSVPLYLYINEPASSTNGAGNATTLDYLDSTQFLRSDQNDTMTGVLNISGSLILDNLIRLDTDYTVISNSTAQTQIGSFNYFDNKAAKLIITAVYGTQRQITELLVTHNNVTAYAVEYGSIDTNGVLATYEVDISGTNVRILATCTSTSTTIFTTSKHLIL